MGVAAVADSQYVVGRAAGMCYKKVDASHWSVVDNTDEGPQLKKLITK